MTLNTDFGFGLIGQDSAVAWQDFLAGTSISDLAATWFPSYDSNSAQLLMKANLKATASGCGKSSSWTAAQLAQFNSLNPNT